MTSTPGTHSTDSDPALRQARPTPAVTEHPSVVNAPRRESLERPPPTRKRKLVRGLLVAFGLLVLLGGLVAIKASQIGMLIGMGEEMAKAGPPPEVVNTAAAEQHSWEGTLSAVASVVSAKGVALSNDSPGVVSRLHFDSGAQVKQGQVLVELDANVERAQLASLKARRELSRRSLERAEQLSRSGAITQSELDSAQASYKSLEADVAALEAQIARKTIRAPFAGKLGIREVNLGQYLAPGTRVTVLESNESVFVDFTMPQRDLERLKAGMTVRAFEDGTRKALGEGKITAIEPSVDAATRNGKVRGALPNLDEALRPGMFVRIEVVLPEQDRVVTVPATAVVHAAYGDSVFYVAEDKGPGGKPRKVARQQFVKLGEARGDFVSVLNGLKAGQEVITAGAFKLRNGMPIRIDNKVKPAAELSPRPENQ